MRHTNENEESKICTIIYQYSHSHSDSMYGWTEASNLDSASFRFELVVCVRGILLLIKYEFVSVFSESYQQKKPAWIQNHIYSKKLCSVL